MARQIDWSKPLSDEDRAWAEQRRDTSLGADTYGDRIDANDVEHGKAAKDAKLTRAERIDALRSTIADSQNEMARLQQEQIDEDNRNAALSGDQDFGLVQRDNTHVDGQEPDGAPKRGPDYSDDKHWTKAALADEIDKRNGERQSEGLDPLPRTGNRSELVERLQKDDEEIAASGYEG